ncbi:MAG: transcription termination/antitermination protein NusG [Bryobacterales bacterium]|nr:transcription termination/antitermination protein NusG [Bryobacterales bacterium]
MNPFDEKPNDEALDTQSEPVEAQPDTAEAQPEPADTEGVGEEAPPLAEKSDAEAEPVEVVAEVAGEPAEAPVSAEEFAAEPAESLEAGPAEDRDLAEPIDSVWAGDASDPEITPELSAEDGIPAAEEAVTADVTEADAEPVEAVQDETPAYEDNPLMSWFIIHTYSGFENKVSESLRTRSEAFGFSHRLGQILIPTEEVVEMRNGKKVTSKRLLYPGYVMVQMEMDDDLWHQVKNTPRVTGFIGGGGKPVPLTATEVNSILFRQSTAAERPRPKLSFDKNETVRIVDGPFANFSGKVDEINPERNTLRVMVTIFGRSTPVELDFLQVEKIA